MIWTEDLHHDARTHTCSVLQMRIYPANTGTQIWKIPSPSTKYLLCNDAPLRTTKISGHSLTDSLTSLRQVIMNHGKTSNVMATLVYYIKLFSQLYQNPGSQNYTRPMALDPYSFLGLAWPPIAHILQYAIPALRYRNNRGNVISAHRHALDVCFFCALQKKKLDQTRTKGENLGRSVVFIF